MVFSKTFVQWCPCVLGMYCYTVPSRLFVIGDSEISSSEDTTQGEPFAMSAYAIGIHPLV